jgi:hypothetical protein
VNPKRCNPLEAGKFELQLHRQPCEPGLDEDMMDGGRSESLDELYGPLSVCTSDDSALAEVYPDREVPLESRRPGQLMQERTDWARELV